MSLDLRAQLQDTLSTTYTLERELGGGGMSRVFTATETRLNRKVVVKVLSPDLAAGVSAERFEREIQLAASLQQANIVPLLAAGDTNGLPYFTMPFVEGESLRARLDKGALSITEVVSVLRDVARALSYAHQHGVVHRDIKPDNVLLSQGAAVVTDFGIAKALSASRPDGDSARLTQMGTSLGTPAYMAPEQAAGDSDIDHRADIYAFGCMAYELVAGRPPFHGRTSARTLVAHMGESVRPVSELRPDVPPVLAALVMHCLAKDADARPQSAEELVRVLDTVTSGGGLQGMPSLLLGGGAAFRKALAIYAGATIAVAVLTRAAIVGIGLPEWVFPGALFVMALGLPVVLWTGYVARVVRRAVTATPTRTPGGTASVTHGPVATMALRLSPHVSWRRTMSGGVIAVGAFVALVTVYMIMRASGLGPFGSLVASGALNPAKSVLVSEFRTTATDSSLGLTIAEGVRLGLSTSNVIRVMTQGEIAAALQRMQRPANSRVDLAAAREIAAREAVTAIVGGEVAGVGTGYVVRVRLVTADSGRELFAEQRAAAGPTELIEAADALTRSLRARIGESLKRVNAAPALAKVTTTSLEALRWYTRGQIANRAGDALKGAEFYRRAVAEDSTFAEAWRQLGFMYDNMGASRTRRDSTLERAYRFRERLPKRDQNSVAASYFSSGPGRDRGKAIAIYQAMLADGDSTWANNLAFHLTSRREYAGAESLLVATIRRDPTLALARANLTVTQIQQGKLASADSTAAAGLSGAPAGSTLFRELRARVRYAQGDLSGASTAWDSLPSAFRTPGKSFQYGALGSKHGLPAVQGRVSATRRLRAEASAIWARSAAPLSPFLDTIAFGLLDVIVGNHGRAVARLDAARGGGLLREGAPIDRPYLEVATLYAQAGRADRARDVLRERIKHVTDTSIIRAERAEVNRVMGEIALAEHRDRDAVTDFWHSDSLPDGPSWSCLRCTYVLLARAYVQAEKSDSAIKYLERYLETPDIAAVSHLFSPDPLYLAPAHEKLGQLYEAKGDTANAVAHYGKFIDLWRNADPELQPRVTEARRRLARIAPTERKK